jgi:hypothetical protein
MLPFPVHSGVCRARANVKSGNAPHAMVHVIEHFLVFVNFRHLLRLNKNVNVNVNRRSASFLDALLRFAFFR